MRLRALCCAVLPLTLAAGCRDADNAWVGLYDVTVTETVAACGGFDPMETVTSSVWRIDTSDGDAFVNGACRLPLDVRSETEAAFAPTRCLTTLPDFRHLTMMVTGGMLVLDGDFLSGDMQYEADVEGLCATGHMTFEGRRR